MARISLQVALLIGSLLIATIVEARSFRQQQVPNGARFSCDTCHGEPNIQPGGLNEFGKDVYDSLDANAVDWPAIASLDSDGDGFVNAVELNDPEIEWRIGMPAPGGPVSNPGSVNVGICDNDNLEDGEECEPGLLGGATCETLGIGRGQLSCYATCRFDITECGYCGDGYRHPYDEECDGDDFDELTCAEASDFAFGRLKCRDDCTIDTSSCTDEPPSSCGDGELGWNEVCDGELFGEWSCQRLGYDNGYLRCSASCEWDADGCYFGEEPPDDWEPKPDPPAADSDGAEPSDDTPACSSVGAGFPAILTFVIVLFGRRRNR